MPRFVLAVAAEVAPVPPFANATVPVTFAALPEKLPLVLKYAVVVVFVPACAPVSAVSTVVSPAQSSSALRSV